MAVAFRSAPSLPGAGSQYSKGRDCGPYAFWLAAAVTSLTRLTPRTAARRLALSGRRRELRTMKRRTVFAIAFALALPAAGPVHAQMRSQPYAPGGYGLPPIVVPQNTNPLPPLTAPTLLAPPVSVSPPPPNPAEKDAEADGGGCTCPAGEKPDADGWCWSRTDAEHGYWERTQKCE